MRLTCVTVLLAMISFQQAFSQTFEVKMNAQRQISDSIIITDTFILRQNATVTFDPALRSCNISCNVFIAERGAKINGRGANGANGVNGRAQGAPGTKGQDGKDGIRLKIQAGVFSYCDIVIDVSGGNGGSGGNGVKGKKGRNASCCTGGAGDGATGGDGGNGGNGGNGGSIRIRYTSIQSLCSIQLGSANFIAKGGSGNSGGAAGAGGPGGNRASGCFPGCNKPGGKTGAAGTAGARGANGVNGTVITE